jgi:predicted oxidoreductase
MKSFRAPQSDLTVSSIVLGLMRIAKMSDGDIRALFDAAVESGVTMIDHADVYGGAPHVCEGRFGDAVKLSAADRGRIMIQTKAGIRKGFFDFSSGHILEAVEGSLKALKTEYIDVLLLHRPDTLVEPDDVAKAFDTLHAAGKVRHFGVSNQTPGQIELLKSAVKQPLLFNQVQLSIPHANLFAQGVAANMDKLDQSISRDVGLLDYSRLKGMTLQAWSPVQWGFFDGVFIGDREKFAELNDVMDELAKKYAVTPTGIAIAWITRHPANLQVVLGTTTPSRVRESAAGSDIVLTREEWYRLFKAGGHTVP